MRIIEYISSCIEQDDMAPVKQEIIRCKDCKYWYQDFDGKCIASTPYGTDTDEDDFCSRAKRKADADEKKQAYEFTITCITGNVDKLTRKLEKFMSDEVGAENWVMCRELIEEEE